MRFMRQSACYIPHVSRAVGRNLPPKLSVSRTLNSRFASGRTWTINVAQLAPRVHYVNGTSSARTHHSASSIIFLTSERNRAHARARPSISRRRHDKNAHLPFIASARASLSGASSRRVHLDASRAIPPTGFLWGRELPSRHFRFGGTTRQDALEISVSSSSRARARARLADAIRDGAHLHLDGIPYFREERPPSSPSVFSFSARRI